jgi:1-acyl-sn-glycerol-3-phosphate acyltransferase
MNYLARETLFRFAPFRWLIRWFDAIPIRREGLGLDGLKETMRRVKRGELVLIFPEGTRTRDGSLGAIQPGFCAIARRVKAPLIPVGIQGAYEVWPRDRALPRLARIRVHIGRPIEPDEMQQLDDEALMGELRRRLLEALQQGS